LGVSSESQAGILTNPDQFEQWLKATTEDALKLQRPLDNKILTNVAIGQKEDGA
jgi:hypothetical protein